MFKKLCGQNALQNVVLVTTMWEKVKQDEGQQRLDELKSNPDFWGWMIRNGSQVFRHTDNKKSAINILDVFAAENSTKSEVILDIQTEMVVDSMSLNETSAGAVLQSSLVEQKSKASEELEDIQAQIDALEFRDKESQADLRKQREDMNEKLRKLNSERENLQVTVERLHAEKYSRLEKAVEEQQASNKAIRKDLKRTNEQAQQNKAELEKSRQQHQQEMEKIDAKLGSLVTERPGDTSDIADRQSPVISRVRVWSQPSNKDHVNCCPVSVSLWGDDYHWCSYTEAW